MMKSALLLISALVLTNAFNNEVKTIAIGDKMPAADTELIETTGTKTSLNGLKGKNGTLVIFSCNTCPFVVGNADSEGWENRYNNVTEVAASHGVSTVLVNSNEAKRDKGDDLESMKNRKEEIGLKAAYVLDKNSVVADAFGARTTPHIFLFNGSNELIYTGAIDDEVSSKDAVKEHWLENALNAHATGKEIDPATTRNIGCSIKRLKKD